MNIELFFTPENQRFLAQVIAFIAMGISFVGFLQKDDSKTLRIIMLAYIFWIIHFTMMEVYAAAAATTIGLGRIFLSMKYKKNKKVFFGILAITIVVGAVTYTDNISLLPIIGSCISAYGYFFFERVRLRIFMLVTSLFWMTFNFHIGSVGGVINDILIQSILIIAMYKMIHEEGKRVYIVDRVIGIITHKEKLPDVGRFIVIGDYIRIFKMGFKNKLKKFLIKMKNTQFPNIYIFKKK